MPKRLYKFHWDCGRMGDVSSVFIAESKDLESAIGKTVYFGEILGKHSEVYGTLDDEDIEVITEDKEVIYIVDRYGLENGYNPLDYIREQEEQE